MERQRVRYSSIVCLILAACAPAISEKSDQEKYCDTWNPRPKWCGEIVLPDGWNKIETAPVLEWVQLLLITRETKVGFRTRENTFLLKDTYEQVYPVAWKMIE